jgi:hypothetical protein
MLPQNINCNCAECAELLDATGSEPTFTIAMPTSKALERSLGQETFSTKIRQGGLQFANKILGLRQFLLERMESDLECGGCP